MDQHEIDDQRELLEAHRKTLSILLEQLARIGKSYAQPALFHDIDEARAGIARCKATLRGWGIMVEDHPDDAATAQGRGFEMPSWSQTALLALHQLRAPQAHFLGRKQEIRKLVQSCKQARLARATAATCCIQGMGGVGKTELALKIASELSDDFPDAQIWLKLRGSSANPTPPNLLLAEVIRAFEPRAALPTDPDELQSLYLSLLHKKSVLILADDAKEAAQVRSLLPPSGCALLITSRCRIEIGIDPIDLEPLPPQEAAALLLKICPRIARHARELAQLCGELPLALTISAQFLKTRRSRDVTEYVAELADVKTKFASLTNSDVSVKASLQLSYDAMRPNQQDAFVQLSVFPASFDRVAAQHIVVEPSERASLLPATYSPSQATIIRNTLEEIDVLNFLQWDANKLRYNLHDLVRVFACELLVDPIPAQSRHAHYYALLAQDAHNQLFPEKQTRSEGFERFRQEWPHIDAGWMWARMRADRDAEDLNLAYATATIDVLDRYYGIDKRLQLLEPVLDLVRNSGNVALKAALLLKLGNAAVQLNDPTACAPQRAIDWYQEALCIARDQVCPRDRRGESRAYIGLGMAQAKKGEHEAAIWSYMRGLSLARNIDDQHGMCLALSNLGNLYVQGGRLIDAIRRYEEGLRLAYQIDDQRVGVKLLRDLGAAYLALAAHTELQGNNELRSTYLQYAKECYKCGLELARWIGDSDGARYIISHCVALRPIRGAVEASTAGVAGGDYNETKAA